ncbi:hypothetical protein EX30DRAFT_348260 [Ascodesmis nigricans]|uniref:Uncharacterized protein n=1 Tax=Ascodesmis nigricans TaxID=341454 RepID=A0A4S2MYK9_9PEZI|nr:hypothetical protein EX30DRAFT_348260 [Ascodesmis nigricans]
MNGTKLKIMTAQSRIMLMPVIYDTPIFVVALVHRICNETDINRTKYSAIRITITPCIPETPSVAHNLFPYITSNLNSQGIVSRLIKTSILRKNLVSTESPREKYPTIAASIRSLPQKERSEFRGNTNLPHLALPS